VRSALLPGYVLAKLPHGNAARDVPLVRGVVSVGGEPAPLPERDVLDLMQASGRTGDRQVYVSRKARRLARYLRRIEARRLDRPMPKVR
jgi:transcription antitermination factor NusG